MQDIDARRDFRRAENTPIPLSFGRVKFTQSTRDYIFRKVFDNHWQLCEPANLCLEDIEYRIAAA